MSTLPDEVLSDLQSFYGRALNKTAAGFYTACLSALNEDDLSRAWVAMKQKERQFPTIEVIKKYCEESREQRHAKLKASAPDWSKLEKSGVTQNGLEALQMMRDLYDGELTHDQYLAKMFEMEEKYPGIGWRKNANELKQFWEKSGERWEKIGKCVLARQWRCEESEVDGIIERAKARKLKTRWYSIRDVVK